MGRRENWSAEQIVATLRQVEIQTAQGKSLAQAQLRRRRSPSRAQRRVSEAGGLLFAQGGAGRDWRLEGSRQPHQASLGPGLPTASSGRRRGYSPTATHASHYAVVSQGQAQNSGQARCYAKLALLRILVSS